MFEGLREALLGLLPSELLDKESPGKAIFVLTLLSSLLLWKLNGTRLRIEKQIGEQQKQRTD
jgi:hypothetical protein